MEPFTMARAIAAALTLYDYLGIGTGVIQRDQHGALVWHELPEVPLPAARGGEG